MTRRDAGWEKKVTWGQGPRMDLVMLGTATQLQRGHISAVHAGEVARISGQGGRR
jgi:hypothetical protein